MAMQSDIIELGVTEIADAVATGALRAEQIAETFLERAHRLDPKIQAFTCLNSDVVLRQAKAIDERRSRGASLGVLAGVPVAIKDAICTLDAPTSCASKILHHNNKPWQSPYDATVVSRLRQADAIIFGKTNLDEFAMGSSTENSALFPTRNPWALDRVPGGSSGGAAAVVAARMAPAALGSDTGGSIRQPAAFTNTVGFKPTYGRVSRYGLVAFASSLDQIGPFANDIRGAARVLQVIAGHDPHDATSVDMGMSDLQAACGQDLVGLRVGVPDEYFGEGIEPDVASVVRNALARLKELGCKLTPVRLPHTKYAIGTYYIIATAEASSNLARFDGVRYGLRVTPDRADLASMYSATRGAGFGREVKRRIMLGTYVLSAGYYDAYYLKAQKVRTLIRRDFAEAFSKVDVIAAPTSPCPAWRLGEKLDDPLAMYLADIFTLPASLAAIPGVSVPCGLTFPTADRPALPVGLQILAPSFEEQRLCRVASAWEKLCPTTGTIPPQCV